MPLRQRQKIQEMLRREGLAEVHNEMDRMDDMDISG